MMAKYFREDTVCNAKNAQGTPPISQERSTQEILKGFDEISREIYRLKVTDPDITKKEIAAKLAVNGFVKHISRQTINSRIGRLKAAGLKI